MKVEKIFQAIYKMEQQETFLMEFQGAAPGDGVLYISGDEDRAMECRSFCSMTDVLSSPEDEDVNSEEIVLMALRGEAIDGANHNSGP